MTVSKPNARIPAGTSWKPKGIRQTSGPDLMCKLIPTGIDCQQDPGINKKRAEPTVNEVRDHDTNGDHNLEQASDTTTDFLGTALGYIGGSDSGDRTDADTGDDTASIDVAKATRATRYRLQDLQVLD